MMKDLNKKVEVSANLAIIALALILCAILVQRYLFKNPGLKPAASASLSKSGSTIQLPGYEWNKSENTLILVLSTTCHFCTESATFYKRILEARSNRNKLRVVAVFPQSKEEGRRYLEALGLVPDEILEAPPTSLGASGTPTVILADSNGRVTNFWRGKLPVVKEDEILKVTHS